MTLNADISTALHLLEHVHERVEDCGDPKLQLHASQDLQSLISLLEDPVFRSIVNIQDSLAELNTQLVQHPSILPGDFEINLGGQLQLSVPTTPVQPVGQGMYQNLYQDNSEIDDQRVPVAPLLHSSSEDTSAQVTSPSLNSEVMGMPPIMTPTYAKEFKKVIEKAARGRHTFTVQLFKPEGTSLGFSVVGLRSNDRDELGIFLQEIQPCGIAENDGRLVEGDQILAIDGQPLDSNISHEQAISILQKARGLVELIVARSAQDIPTDELSGAAVASAAAAGAGAGGQSPAASPSTGSQDPTAVGGTSPDKDQSLSTSGSKPATAASPAAATPSAAQGNVVERSNSAVSESSKSGDMVLNTEWAQVEVINLINDGSGLGFGIIGGRSTGVVVKTILPGGVADRDNRLQSGDHILQIGDVNLRGMGSEQVASVLRQSGTHVRLVVARPVEPTSPDYQALGSHAPIVPTKILGDPEELDRYLVRSGADAYNQRRENNGSIFGPDSDLSRPSLIMDSARPSVPISELPVLSMDPIDVNALPEMERFTVELRKDSCGLGITIAGYVCEKEELSGIFVKSISDGSAADLSGKIQINDRIVEVNGHSLQGYSNHEAVEVLRSTGLIVKLCLERYLRGPKYEQLQQAIAASELRMPQPGSPSITSLPTFPISADGDTTLEIEPEGESHTTVDSGLLQEIDRDTLIGNSEEITNIEALLSDPSTELTPKIEAAIKSKWQKIVGPEIEIVVAQLKKFKEGSGLGISLEGTVDVENGQEVRPHHYIRSILPDGPVGQNGILRSGDELLEVNGYRLLGINHMEVVSVLKELPIHVRMVCGRNTSAHDPLCPIDTAQHQAAFQTRSILGGSLQNLLPSTDRLVKAKSDGSLASTTTTASVTDASLNKMKSRSLEPLTGLAMWSSEPQIIELVKGERGLGFSILDYQDPMNPNETVIVIRSLVPGGVAQVDGQLIPGDRLLFVNDIALENATLDQAVQALKGAPKGVVRIGVAKPLPIPDSIAQRLTQGGVVRRTKSLTDSDATEQAAADLNDFLSSRSGTSVAAGSERSAGTIDAQLEPQPSTSTGRGMVTAAAQVHQSADLTGFVQLLPRARRKEDEDQDDLAKRHKPIVKLTPFSEEERRAMLSQESVDFPGTSATAGTPVATPTTSTAARRRSLREQESLERVAHFLEHQQQESRVEVDVAGLPAESPSMQDEELEQEDNRLTEKETPAATRGDQWQLLAPSVAGEEQAPSQQRSSLRRRREDTGEAVVKDMQERTIVIPIEPSKKTVRICSVDEEIRIESFDSAEMDDFSSYPEMQEVQLVTAKILTAEELADSIARREESSKVPSRDEAEAILRLDTRLQVPALKPSASENALTGAARTDDKISEKNIKREILMDLSQACVEEPRPPVKLLTSPCSKRKLSRVKSDGPEHQVVKFQLGDEEEHRESLRRSRTDLSTFGLRELCERWKSDEGKPVIIEEKQSDKKWKSTSDVPRSQDEDVPLAPVKRWLSESSALAPSRSRPCQRRSLPSDLRRRGSKQHQEPPVAVVLDHRAPVRDALLLKEEPPPPDDAPDGLIREHSLKYQQQTLESPGSFEDLETDASSPAQDFEADHTLDYSSSQSLLSTSFKSYSPKREAETQTQGENKHTQYSVEDLLSYVEDVYDSRSGSREQLEFLIEARFGSPRREADTQTELESKGCQCESEELAASGEFGPFFKRQQSFGSPRKEAEVQTGQDSRSTQCTFEEFGIDGHRGLRWKQPLRGEPRPPTSSRVVACGTSSLESSSSPGSQSPQRETPPPPLIVLVKGGGVTKQIDMTVTHRDRDGNVVWEKHWGPERLVEIYREHQTSLGLSIVGGKVDLQDSSSSSKSQNVSGIFIKNVLPNSPAGRAGGLQIGDRIIEVDGVDLRNSTHERAVKAIQAAGNPVRLLVQSLVHLSPDNEDQDRDGAGYRAGAGGGGGSGVGRWQSTRASSSFRRKSGSPTGHRKSFRSEGRSGMKRQESGGGDTAGPSNRRSSMKKSIRKRAPSPPGEAGNQEGSDEPKKQPPAPKPANKYSSGESSEEEEDTRDLEGNVYTKTGIEISRKSAANVKRSKQEIADDPEEEDEFGYTTNKVKKKYHNLKKPVYLVKLDRDRTGMGISLAGHKDRNKMAVFICGLNPSGMAAKTGELQVGDEILEVNGQVFQGRCHLNASSMIKGMPFTSYKIVVVRRPGAIDNCAVKHVTHFPTALAGEDYSHLKGVHAVPIKKGQYGLGIMIIEGKHGEVGQGIFVSDIQEGSAAEQAGLNVGDMILSVNADSVMGATFDEATALLKKAEGVVTLTVCNPNQKKVAEDEAKRARGEKVEEPGKDAKKNEKPKDEGPGDPKDCNIRMNKDTTIEFPKDKNQPIGFITIGGNDTSLNGVFILDVFTDGAAGKDGRLKPGDRIVEFNKEIMKTMEQEKAYQTIMRFTQGPVHMIVHRDEMAVEEFEVELTKKSGKGSGLVLTGYKSGKGAYVSEVVAGGTAAENGRIIKGDRVVAVGGTDLREAPVEDIALHVKVSNPVQLKLARYRAK